MPDTGTRNSAQPNPLVSEPDDVLEQEADLVAERVTRMPQPAPPDDPETPKSAGIRLSRRASSASAQAMPEVPSIVHEVVRSPGEPLDAATRAFMEPRFGHDFGKVRVHSGAAAEQSAKEVRAQAYTVGHDVVFGSGRFAPNTSEGRRLLAHELTHVVQQSDAHGTAAPVHALQRKPGERNFPAQPTKETARYEYSGDFFYYLIANDIQWHFNGVLRAGPWGIDLVIAGAQELRKKLSSKQIAQTATEVLAAGIGLPLQGSTQALIETIAEDIDKREAKDAAGFIVWLDFDQVRAQFDTKTFDAYWADLKESEGSAALQFHMLAAGDFATGKDAAKGAARRPGAKAEPKRPVWVQDRTREVNALLDKLRQEKPRPRDLPDRLVLWYNERDASWYFNVWVSLDTQGNVKRSYPLQLKPDETADELLARVRDATVQALQRAEDRERRQFAEDFAPAWALELERQLKQRLDQLRAREKKATDFPDGMVLVPGTDLHLQIWVERGSGPSVQRNTGSVPLVQRSTVDQLVPYVRHVAAMLRQYEKTPDEEQPVPKGVEVKLEDPEKVALAAFPAQIRPVDMRGDNITVTGAQNEFHMEMDYEHVYGGGPLKDLAIASKLSQQYIHFFWEVYSVPKDVPRPKGQKAAPDSWYQRWQWLYDSFNPPADEQGHREKRQAFVSGPPLTKTDGSDSAARVKLPSEPGDYLVRCVTGHAPIGESKLKRRSSEAYYPVRVQPIQDVAKGAASLRTGAMAAMEAELQTIETQLAGEALRDNERRALLAKQEIRKADLDRLRRKETQTLGQNTAEEIAYATDTQAKLKRLQQLLPDALVRAKAQGIPPSSLLKDTPDLLTLYWFLIAEGKTPEAYEKELAEKGSQLQGVQRRAGKFANELKASSRYQYSPEAVVVSEVTGRVYPLVLMLGEAPEAVKMRLIADKGVTAAGALGDPSRGVAYSLVDVTAPETQKVYYGYSTNSGPEGHREAIDDAFKNFGEDATYGEGLIAARIPPGAAGAKDKNYPGSDIKTYKSKEGLRQKVLWALGIIAAVAGVAALVATGVGAPVAAGILGLVASVAGAVTSLHNISERQRRHTLELDAELVLDIIGFVAVVPAAAGLNAAKTTARGLQIAVSTERFLRIATYTEIGATVILVPTKLAQDIGRIQNDPDLDDAQKQAMIEQARAGAVQAGIMLLGSMAAAHAGARRPGQTEFFDEGPMRRQTELLELEGFGEYKSMQERGWLDGSGKWTDQAPEIVRAKATPPEVPAAERPPTIEEPPPPAEKTAPPKVETPPEVPAKEPVAPSAEAPVKPPTIEEPVTTPVTEEPVTTPAVEQPTKAPTTKKPPKTPKARKPAKTPAAEEPVKAPTAEEPVKTPAAEEPVTTPVAEEPATTPKEKKPAKPRKTKKPVEAPVESAEAPEAGSAETPARLRSVRQAAREEVRTALDDLQQKKTETEAKLKELSDQISRANRRLTHLKEQANALSKDSGERAKVMEEHRATKEALRGLQEEQGGYIDDRIRYNKQQAALEKALELERPGFRKDTLDAIKAAAKKTADGKFIDPNTNKVIEGDFDIGHKYGREHRRLVLEAVEKRMTQAEFNDWINNHPEWFQIEDPASNRSGTFEKPGID